MTKRVSVTQKPGVLHEFNLYLDGRWITSGELEWCQKIADLLEWGINWNEEHGGGPGGGPDA